MNTSMYETHSATSETALLMARQALYRFVALSLLDPQAGGWEQLDALRYGDLVPSAAALIRGLSEAVPEYEGLGETSLDHLDPGLVLDRLPATQRELNVEYERTFGLLVSNACPPYETEYINSKFSFQRSNVLADVGGFYRAFGMCVSGNHPDRPDHIVLELEFMATVIALETRAVTDGLAESDERQHICRDAQVRFLKEHLAWWAPVFAKLLEHENPGGFYAAVGEFLAAMIPAERALLGVESAEERVAPTFVERPEECEGCQLTA